MNANVANDRFHWKTGAKLNKHQRRLTSSANMYRDDRLGYNVREVAYNTARKYAEKHGYEVPPHYDAPGGTRFRWEWEEPVGTLAYVDWGPEQQDSYEDRHYTGQTDHTYHTHHQPQDEPYYEDPTVDNNSYDYTNKEAFRYDRNTTWSRSDYKGWDPNRVWDYDVDMTVPDGIHAPYSEYHDGHRFYNLQCKLMWEFSMWANSEEGLKERAHDPSLYWYKYGYIFNVPVTRDDWDVYYRLMRERLNRKVETVGTVRPLKQNKPMVTEQDMTYIALLFGIPLVIAFALMAGFILLTFPSPFTFWEIVSMFAGGLWIAGLIGISVREGIVAGIAYIIVSLGIATYIWG